LAPQSDASWRPAGLQGWGSAAGAGASMPGCTIC
jgi:hypothetical protein